jgi:hypothetical protein
MYCKLCNTRLNPGEKNCQNCGTATSKNSLGSMSPSVSKLPSPEMSTARDTEMDVEDEIEVELELDDVTAESDANADSGSQAGVEVDVEPEAEVERPVVTRPRTRLMSKMKAAPKIQNPFRPKSTNAPKPPAPAPAPAKPAAPPVSSPGSSGSARAAGRNDSTGSITKPLVATDSSGLRALLAEQPETLEPGLEIFCSDDGTPVGADYSTGVGDIDLLARDAEGGLVVVMISERDQGDELVAEVLQRVGWVRKHLGEKNQQVRGIVLCESAPENLSYAAAAVAGTVAFKTYRVALTFEDLEI